MKLKVMKQRKNVMNPENVYHQPTTIDKHKNRNLSVTYLLAFSTYGKSWIFYDLFLPSNSKTQ